MIGFLLAELLLVVGGSMLALGLIRGGLRILVRLTAIILIGGSILMVLRGLRQTLLVGLLGSRVI